MSPLPATADRLHVRQLAFTHPVVAFAPLAQDPYALLLDDRQNDRARIYAFPDRTFEGARRADFDALAEAWRHDNGIAEYAGLFGYDLAAAFETLPDLPSDMPPLAIGRYPAWAEFDGVSGVVTVRGESEAAVDRLIDAFGHDDRAHRVPGRARWRARWSEAEYLERASRARDYVHAGDVFQVNLSQRFDVDLQPGDDPWNVFALLCSQSPAPHAAYFRVSEGLAVLTNSPERFLSVRDGRVETRPIKGTRPRHPDPRRDVELAAELARSEKDRAENLMIVDLMRNDLSRVCESGSVHVPSLCQVESYANVHHLVSVVEGKLGAGRDAFDLIAASFPPGSITGAPKVRAMEIIAELEGEARGPYCGALGWIGGTGDLDLNVMIRTVAFRRDGDAWSGSLRSGGGIVADSVAEDEYAETLTKASALRRALGAAE